MSSTETIWPRKSRSLLDFPILICAPLITSLLSGDIIENARKEPLALSPTIMTVSFQISRIGQIAINAKDIPSATAFYRDVLGLKHLFSVDNRMAFFDCNGVRLMLSQPSAPELDHPSSILYFVVADIDAAYHELQAKGVTFVHAPQLTAKMPDHELWLCPFRDPAGNLHELMSEKRNQR